MPRAKEVVADLNAQSSQLQSVAAQNVATVQAMSKEVLSYLDEHRSSEAGLREQIHAIVADVFPSLD